MPYLTVDVSDDEVPEHLVRTITTDLETALDMVQAAEVLGLGVRLTNQWTATGGDDSEKILEWVIVLAADAPEEDD